MAKIKIDQLPETGSLSPTDIMPVVGLALDTTYKITVKNFTDSLTEVSSSMSASFVTASNVYGPYGSNSVISSSYTLSSSYSDNGGVKSIQAGSGISVDTSTGNVTITNTGAGGAAFPYVGSAQISGSLGITGSLSLMYKTNSSYISLYYPNGAIGNNIWIGNGGFNSTYAGSVNASYNTSLGFGALSGSTYGNSNTAVGFESLKSNTAGYSNTAIGVQALKTNDFGDYNTAIGNRALESLKEGLNKADDNTAVGAFSAWSLELGRENTIIGARAFMNAVSLESIKNVAVGAYALYDSTGISNNVAIGHSSLSSSISGSNTALGNLAGAANVGGENNIFIGYNVQGENANESNRTFIGNLSTTSTWLGGNLLLGTRNDNGNKLQVSGSATITGSLNVTGSIYLNGSQLGTSNSFPYTGSAQITGSLGITGSISTIGNVLFTGSLVVSGSNGAGVFSQGLTLVDYISGISSVGSYMAWRAPFSCSVVALYGYYSGGTAPQINAVRSGSSGYGKITGSNVTVYQENTWVPATGSGLQNNNFNIGDSLQIVMSGSNNNQLAVQVDFIRKF